MRRGYTYFFRPVGADGPVKVGFSRIPEERLITYMAWSPIPLEIVAAIEGRADLERRFHALFAPHHSHHEWFNGHPDITAVIDAIRAGSFDITTLPAPRCLWSGRPQARESVDSSVNCRRLNSLAREGIPIPDDVRDATDTYQVPAEEKARRRRLVREFVERHAHVKCTPQRRFPGYIATPRVVS